MWKIPYFCILNFLFIVVKSDEKPILQQILVPQNLEENQILKLNCELTKGDLPISYEWYFGNKILENNFKTKVLTNEDSSKLTIKDLSFYDIGYYECKAKNSFGVASRKVLVSLNMKPKWFQGSMNKTSTLNNLVEINCEAFGFPKPSIKLVKKNSDGEVIIDNLVDNKYHFVLTKETIGLYKCLAGNSLGSIEKTVFVSLKTILAFTQADDCKCRLRTENRIVNGEKTVANSIPWIVSLAVRDEHICGGSILNEKFILTTASCVKNFKAKKISVRVGISDEEKKVPKNQIYSVKNIHSQEYVDLKSPGDLAILELSKKITFVDGVIEKGCYNLEKRDYSDQFLAAGWGIEDPDFIRTNKIRYYGFTDRLRQGIFDQDAECDDFSICLKMNEKKQIICSGDGGVPLHYTENGLTNIEGVASYSTGSKQNGIMIPCTGKSVFSRLSHYADWINHVADYDFCGAGERKEGDKVEKSEKKKRFGIF